LGFGKIVYVRQAYKEPSIISGTGAVIWSNVTLGLLTTITLRVVPFRTYVPFPALLLFFKCILEVELCEGVQHCLQFCPDHLSYVKMVAFQFYLKSGKQRKVRLTVMLFVVKNPLVKKEMWDGVLSCCNS
jgi:hypothetical protein